MATRGRTGRLVKTVTVETDDPANPVVRLQLSGEIVVEASLEPERISFGQVDRGETVTKTAVLRSREPGSVRLTSVEIDTDNPDLTARLTKVEGAEAVELRLAAKKAGRFRGQVKVATSSTKQPAIELFVSGEVMGQFDLLPVMMSFTEPGEGAPPQKRIIKVKSRGGVEHRVTGARDPAGFVSARVQKVGELWEVELTLDRVPEERRGVIEITTSAPDEPTIEARYFVRSTAARHLAPEAMRLPPRGDPTR